MAKKWSSDEMARVADRGRTLSSKGYSGRAIAVKLQKTCFKKRSVESVRHMVRDLVW